MRQGHELAAYPENRPERTASERQRIAEREAAHLPEADGSSVSDQDIRALKAAFISRFDEPLPRTETLFAVARIGRRMAKRDSEQANPSTS